MTTRDARPWGREEKSGPFDAIIIGSGIGGMTAAALLAKTGMRCCILEQHYVPGGFTHTFTRKNYRWDVGVHAVGEVTVRSMPGRLLRALTDGKLEWAPLGPVYDAFHFPGGMQVDFPDSPGQYRHSRQGEIVRCPWHQWEFDIKTGRSWCDPRRLRLMKYSVAVEPGARLVEGPYVAETFKVAIEDDYVVVTV